MSAAPPFVPMRRSSFIMRFIRLAGPYWTTPGKWKARGLVALHVLLTCGQALSPVLLNMWSERLFDALEARSIERFVFLIGGLTAIIVINMVIAASQNVVMRNLQLGWRLWLTQRLFTEWMSNGHHYQITHIPGEHDNPDGRIAEDARISTESAIELLHSLLYCLLLLASFTKILWSLSGSPDLDAFGLHLYLPGHLVWVALLYAAVGSSVALLLGKPLVRSVNRRQSGEANFRFGLVHARENSEAIALINGEEREQRHLIRLVQGVAAAFNQQTRALTNIMLFQSGYGVLSAATVFPVMIAAPRYIAGTITLGILMQTAQAFQQMEGALSWPIDNLSLGAGWRASVERILNLHEAILNVSAPPAESPPAPTLNASSADDSRIVITRGERPVLAFHDVAIHDPSGMPVISNFTAEIACGEHVLISGDPSATIKLFKVVAQLWPWGSGRVELPHDATIFFMPERPYLPAGTLRASLSYPAARGHFDDAALAAALRAVGLDDLGAHLDVHNTWAKVLSTTEQQRLGFARLLLHRPNWIFLQGATDGLDADSEHAMMRLLTSEFPEATVLTVGSHSDLEDFHQRKLVLVRKEDGLCLITDRRKGSRPSPRTPPSRFTSQMVNIANKDINLAEVSSLFE